MKTWKGLAIVGALALGVVVSSMPVTGQGVIPLPSHGQWKKLCKDQAESPEACQVAVSALEAVVRGELDENSTVTGFVHALLPEIKKALHLKGKASCTECLNEAVDFLNLLAQNTTIHDIEVVGHLSCDEKFVDPALADQCSEFIDTYLPQVIQVIENDLPPAEICAELGHCPAP